MTTFRDERILTRITETELDAGELLRFVSTPGSGGVVSFSGIVRNEHGGREVRSIEYTAARPLADIQLAQLCGQILLDPEIQRVAAAHRLGSLDVGDASVIVAASAAHREAAFRGARKLIDRIKEVLPVWKREHFAEGEPEWVAGFTIAPEDRAPKPETPGNL